MPATLVEVEAVESLDVKATLIADILTAIYGDSAETFLDYKPSPISWKSVSDYANGIFKAARKLRTTSIGRDPRDGDGDGIIFDGTPQERSAEPPKKRGAKRKNTPEQIQAVHARIDDALKGNKSPESAVEIADMLGGLTVKELRDVKIKFGIAASGKVKSELVAKIAKRLDAGRRADHSMNPQTGNGIRLTDKDKYYLKPIIPKTDGLTPGGKSHEFAKRQATALNNLLEGKPLSAEDRKIVTEAIIKDFTYMSTAGGGVAGSHRDARIAATQSILEQMGINPKQELEKYRESQKEREDQQEAETRIFRRMGPESTPDGEPRKPMRLASERAERARREVEEAQRVQAEKEATEKQQGAGIGGQAIEQIIPDMRTPYEKSRDKFNEQMASEELRKRQESDTRSRKLAETASKKAEEEKAKTDSKPGHELTLQEYRDRYGKSYGDMTDSVHRRLVQRAMERGEKVSDEVLDSHPDLKPKAPVAKQVYQRPRQLAHHSLTATDPQGRYTDEQIAQRQAIDRAQYALDVYNVAPERYTGGPIDQETVDRLINRYQNAAPKMWDGIDTALTDEDRARISGKPTPAIAQTTTQPKQETEEQFTLSRSTPKTPKVATFENNDASKQGALFDTGKGDLRGQELLFNTDAGDVTNPKTMENRIAGERISPKPQGRDIAEVLKRSSTATKNAVNSRAKKLEVDPVEYFQAVEDAYRIESQNHAQRERMKRTAREYTGLTSADIAKVENNYKDHDSVTRFDDSVKAMRDAYPELEYMEDANDFVWTLIREGKKDPKPRHHPDVLRAADEMITSNKRSSQRQLASAGGSGGSETLEGEDDWVPVEHRGWIKWLKQQNATPFNQGPMSIAMVSKALFSRAMMLKAEIRDGDGDGMINDGTPQEQPVSQAVEEEQPTGKEQQAPKAKKQTFGGLFRSILTDPTRADRAFVGEHLKNMATFKLDQDSLLRKAFQQITFDPTKADRESLVEYAKDVVKLKPVANALKTIFDPGPGVREAMEIARDTTKTIRWVADKTLGAMFRMLSRDMRRSAANGPRNANFNPYTITGPMPGNMRVRSFKSADTGTTADPFDLTGIDHTPYIDMVVEMVKTDSIDEVNEAIVKVMEHMLQSRQPKSSGQLAKALFSRAAMMLKEVGSVSDMTTTLKITASAISESLLVRCNLSQAASPIEVNYLAEPDSEFQHTQFQCADARHRRDLLADIGADLLADACLCDRQELGELSWVEVTELAEPSFEEVEAWLEDNTWV